jgi:hypothetical protein
MVHNSGPLVHVETTMPDFERRTKRIVELDALQKSQRQIAEELGISKSTVQRVLRGVKHPKPRIPGAFVTDVTGKSRQSVKLARKVSGQSYSNNSWVGAIQGILPPPEYEASWRSLEFSQKTLDSIQPQNLIELLANASPDISRAMWDTIQMVDPGHEIVCWDKNSDRTKQNKRAQRAADTLTQRIISRHGSEAALYAQLTIGAFLRGAWFSELILDPEATEALDIVAPDPMSVRFRSKTDPIYGDTYEMGQLQQVKGRGVQWVSIEAPTVIYIPIQPMPGSPYGRPPVAPAIFPALFLLSVLHDMKRVVAQSGYQRFGIKIILDKLSAAEAIEDTDDMQDAILAITKEIETAWSDQNPDDIYIFPDYVEPQTYEGAISSSSSTVGSAESLIGALERMLVRALKSMPIVMGAAEGVSEANANRQWEMYMASIRSFQDDLSTMMETHYTTALNTRGIQADVQFIPKEVRASEAYRDAQAQLVRVSIAEKSQDRNWMGHDEAAEFITGHKAIGPQVEQEVKDVPDTDTPDAGGETDGEPPIDENRG